MAFLGTDTFIRRFTMSYNPLCIRNTTSKQVPSGFLRFSIKDKINLKEKNLIKIKHEATMKH